MPANQPSRQVQASEITWTFEPLPVIDLATLTDEDIAMMALSEAGGYRALALAAIGRLWEKERALETNQKQIAALRDELRRYTTHAIGLAP